MNVIVGESGGTELGWHRLATFLKCPKEFQLAHVRRVHKPETREPDALAIGSLLHAGRAKWFAGKCAASYFVCDKALHDEAERLKLPSSLNAVSTAEKMLYQYISHWSKRPMPTVRAVEYKLGPAPLFPGDPPSLHATGKPDDISKYPEGGDDWWLGDLKTTSGSVPDLIRQYEQSGQLMLGLLLFQNSKQGKELQKQGISPAGYMLDIAVKPDKTGKCAFSRFAVRVTDFQLRWFVESTRGFL